jgi:hypothetical protein
MWIFILLFAFVCSMSTFLSIMPIIAGDVSIRTYFSLPLLWSSDYLLILFCNVEIFPFIEMLFIFEVFTCIYIVKFLLNILRTLPICHLHPLSVFHSSLVFPQNSKLHLAQRNLLTSKRHGTEFFPLQEGSVLSRYFNYGLARFQTIRALELFRWIHISVMARYCWKYGLLYFVDLYVV